MVVPRRQFLWKLGKEIDETEVTLKSGRTETTQTFIRSKDVQNWIFPGQVHNDYQKVSISIDHDCFMSCMKMSMTVECNSAKLFEWQLS